MNLVVVTNILTPYRIPLFQSLADRVDDLTVLLMADREDNRHWNIAPPRFRTVVLPGFHLNPPGYEASLHVNYGVMRTLRALAPDVVISGGFAPANLAALRFCGRSGAVFVGWGELTLRDLTTASIVRRTLRRWTARRSAGAVASTSEACEVFVRDGVPRERVLTAPMPVDVEFLRARTIEARRDDQHRCRRERYSSPVLLSIGQLIARKGFLELFAIYELLLLRYQSATLLILGEGPERRTYQDLVDTKGWKNVHFAGFVQPEELPKWLALADVFVFPSLFDPFGAVLAEAMAAGLPVTASIHAAATEDLVVEAETGIRIDPRDTASSAAAIARLLDLPPARRAAMGEAASRSVGRFTFEATAETMVRFMRGLCQSRHGRHRSSDDIEKRSPVVVEHG